LKISIVIPVYNEESHLPACLASIASQSIMPDEVIVVDNNSSDSSVSIAESFPFVKVLSQKRQGVVHARNLGFNAASGDIIGRIDADSVLPKDWVEKALAIMSYQTISAVSGSPHYYDFAFYRIADKIDLYLRRSLSQKLKDNNFLWGSNMAIRQRDWQKVRSITCSTVHVHEDLDLALHLQSLGLNVVYDEILNAGVSSRRVDVGFLAFVRYAMAGPHTYARHNLSSRKHMYPVLIVCWLAYLPGRIIYRGYNTKNGEFSWSKLLTVSAARVDPTTNVI
jgi:glycosyltransferase involved in cell wall biosynthesis